MPSHKVITEAAAKRFNVPDAGQVDHFDHAFPGLSLRVSCGGRKTWSYTYRIGGKQKRISLGLFPAELNVAQAHDAWRKARDLVKKGRDPSQDRSGATDFRSVFEEWLQRDQAGNKSRGLVARKLEKHVLPFWQHRPIADIGRRDVLDVIDRIADAGEASLILILSDINMPGMSGLDLLPKANALRPDVPVIMITAYGDAETKRKALETGAETLLTKPIDFETLRNEIDQRVERAA